MSDFTNKLSTVLKKCVKIVASGAKTLINNIRFWTEELSNRSKRRDLIKELGLKALELSQNGADFPLEMNELVKQIVQLDMELDTLKTAHAVQKAAAAEKHAAEKAARAAEKAASVIEQSTAAVDIEIPETVPVAEIQVPAEEEVRVPTLDIDEAVRAAENSDHEEQRPTLNV